MLVASSNLYCSHQFVSPSFCPQRAHLLMSEVPVLLTLLAPSGIVLSQNEASVLYFGQLEGLDITGRAIIRSEQFLLQ
jgi:hypothetical protein